jgi:PAS domain S-box-containing protein
MSKKSIPKTKGQQLVEKEDNYARLSEAEETLNAIRSGEIDAIIASGPDGDQVYSISTAETPYRVFIEEMNEGAATLSEDGTILFCNRKFAELLNESIEHVIGLSFKRFISQDDQSKFDSLQHSGISGRHDEVRIASNNHNSEPIFLKLSISPLPPYLLGKIFILIATDISVLKKKEKELRETDDLLEQRLEELNESRITTMKLLKDTIEAKNIIDFTNQQLTKEITRHKWEQKKLRESEAKFKKIYEDGPLGMVMMNIDFHFIMANNNFCRMLGYDEQELKNLTFKDITHPDYISSDLDNIKKLVKGDIPVYKTEKRYIRKDKEVIWGSITLSVFRSNDGKTLYLFAMIVDITERKLTEENLLKANRIYAVISQISHAIIRERDKDKLLKEVCNIAVEFGKFRMAWIGFADEETKLVQPIAFAGVEDGYFSRIKISINDEPEGRGPTGTTIREGRHTICDDIESDPRMVIWKDEALKRSYHSSIGLPVKLFGKGIGAFTLYSSLPHFFNQEEIELLDEVSADLSFALEAIETEKKRQETLKALRESQENLKKAQEIAKLGSWQLEIESDTLTWSDEVFHIFEIDPGKLQSTYEAFLNASHPDDRAMINKAYTDSLQNKIPYEIDHRLLMNDGRIKFVHESCSNYYDKNGKPIRSFGTVQDITERKLKEKVIQESEMRLRNVIEGTNVGTWEWYVQTGETVFNERWAEIIGYTLKELAPISIQTWLELTYPEDLKKWEEQMSQVFAQTLTYNDIECRMKHRNGSWAWVHTRGKVVEWTEDGKPWRMAGTHTDITERKQTEKELKDTTARLTEAQAVAKIGSWETNLLNLKAIWSEETYRIFELDTNSFQPSHQAFLNFIHPEDRAKVNAAFVGSFEKDSENAIEHRIVTSSGLVTFVEERWRILHDDQRRPLRVVGTCQDITGRKQAEREQFRLLDIIENSLNEIYVFDSTTLRFEYVNQGGLQNLGYTLNEMQTLTPPNIKPEYTEMEYRKMVQPLLSKEKERLIFETIHRRKNGTDYPVEVYLQLHFQEDKSLFISVINDITERKGAEEELRQSEELFHIIFEQAHTGIALVDSYSGKILIVNTMFANIVGRTREEMAKIDWMSITHPDDMQEDLDNLALLNTGEIAGYQINKRYLRPDGSVVWINMIISPILVEDKSHRLHLCMIEDITDRKWNEALNASKMHLIQFSAEHSLDVLLGELLNETEKLTGSIISFIHFVDDNEESIILQNWSDRTKAEFCKAEGKGLHYPISEAGVWTDCVRKRKPVIHNDYPSLPHRKGLPEGHAELIRELVVPIFRGEKITAILGIGNKPSDYTQQDVQTALILANSGWEIVERMKTEEALKVSQLKYRIIADNTYDWEFWRAPDGSYLYQSPSCKRITGYSAEEFINDTELIIKIIHPEDRDAYAQHRKSVQNDPKPGETEFRIITPDGTMKWIDHICQPVFDSDGKFLGTRGNNRDITDRKLAEEALQESEKGVRRKLDAILSPDVDISELELSDIIDSEKIQKLMDEFYRLTRIGIGIIDLHGRVLVKTGWQDICTKFHRINPESCRLCIESDLQLSRKVPDGTFKQFRCQNSMWDISTPIMLGDKHVGNIFLGQFLFDDETPDYEIFRQQALKYGFNEQEYISALDRVPRWNHETLNAAMSFYTGFAGIIGDLSYSNIKLANALEERKRVEESLWESSQMLNLVLNHMPSFVFWKDRNSVYLGCNYLFSANAGLSSQEEIIGLTDLDLPWKDTEAESYRADDRMVMETGISKINYEEAQLTIDGRFMDIRTSKIPMRNHEGNIIGVLGTFEDITDRKLAEEEIQKLNKTLEERVAQRTAQLEVINNELESFSYSISHDLRAPLRAIGGFSQILSTRHRESLNDEGRQYMDYIVEASLRMEQLINDLLDYSRLGRKSLDFHPVKLSEIVDNIHSDFKTKLNEIGAEFIVDSELPEISGEESLLRQIFSNLIENAITYRRKEVRLKIKIDFEPEANGYILKITDNGIGIPKEYWEKIFNVFQRLHSEDVYPGTGIGLATVRKALSILHGTIRVESVVGEGSSFIIYLTK